MSQVMRKVLATSLVLHVYDKDSNVTRRGNDLIGEATVSLRDMERLDVRDFAARLSTQGHLFFTVEWLPLVPRPPKVIAV